ncbi:MAG: hypothetical protein KDC39_07330 [Actinobacteria bacterium]|nr:hypothetical protein [Actinomycetota bacterium]
MRNSACTDHPGGETGYACCTQREPGLSETVALSLARHACTMIGWSERPVAGLHRFWVRRLAEHREPQAPRAQQRHRVQLPGQRDRARVERLFHEGDV